ncbi:MAG: glycosyltransferase family 4 protein [Candidatus Latescibacteria bacterium]|nr:glycosyltransferase family 4 protein [Candidatus Latescibacterota bacterium]
MRVLLLSQYYPPEVGATQTRMMEFAKYLKRKGHEVFVVCEIPNHPTGIIPEFYRGKWYHREDQDGVTVIHTWVLTSTTKTMLTRIGFYISFMVSGLVGGLMLPRCDVVFATSPPLFVGVTAYLLSRLKRTPYVFDVRDLWPGAAVALGELSNKRLIRIAEFVERFLYRHATEITAVTRGFCAAIESTELGRRKVHWIPNGTIPSLFRPLPPSQDLIDKLDLRGRFVVTFAGTHGIAQALSSILDCAECLKNMEEIVFLFIGDGPAKARLVEDAQTRRLSNIRFHEQVPLNQIPEFIAISQLMLVPLRRQAIFDTFIPSKMFDFMACGKPVILTVPGEAREILEEAGAGCYVEPEEPAQLAEAIISLKEQPGQREQYGERGYEYVIRRFTRETSSAALEQLLKTCIAPR